jgi:putative FmdB family regulatory protein
LNLSPDGLIEITEKMLISNGGAGPGPASSGGEKGMPIYDLKCDDCGHRFEKFITGFLKDKDKECPRCYSRRISQQFSGGSFGVGGSSAGGGCSAPPRSGFG